MTALHERRGSGKAAGILLLLVVALLPIGIRLSRGHAVRHMEVMALVSSQETWQRMHDGEHKAWLRPSWNGRPRIRKPPMTVWINLAVWTGLTPENSTVDQRIFRARLAGVALLLVALAGLAWMSRMLKWRRGAWAAPLICGTAFIVLRQARIASYDTHLLGWMTLAVVSGYAAFRSRTNYESTGRTAAVWLLHLLCSIAALLTKGPVALAFVYPPLVALTWKGPHRGRRLGLLIAALILVLLSAAPWFLHVLRWSRTAGHVLTAEWAARRPDPQPVWYYLGLVPLLFPWTFPFLAAVIEALRPGRDRSRALQRAGGWLLVVLILLSIPAAKQQRYLMPALPPAALMAAALFVEQPMFGRLRIGQALKWGHGGLLLVASVLFPLAVIFDWGGDSLHVPVGALWPTVLWGAVLLACAVALIRALRVQAPRAAWLTALWMSIASAYVFAFYITTDEGRYAGRPAAEALNTYAGIQRVSYLRLDPGDIEPDQKFLLYAERVIRPYVPGADPAPARPVWLMADDNPRHREWLSNAGYRVVDAFHDGRRPRVLAEYSPGNSS